MAAPRKLDVLQGTLDLLILRTLQRGPQHGHGVGQAIRAWSDDLLQVEHGSLYPALHRLQKEGWIESEWGVTDNSQRAKFYQLTPAGKKQLAAEESKWNLFVQTVARVLRPREQE
jgi:PadR family transcriptional regulator PadR